MCNNVLIASYKGFNLYKEGKLYYIKELKDQYLNMSGEKIELIDELKRCMQEVDYNNDYMLDIENHFINILELQEINIKDLNIKNLKGVKFGNNAVQCEIRGFAIYNKDLGYMQLSEKTDGVYNIQLPYNPTGGKPVLEEFLETWSMEKFKEVKWIKSYN